LRSFFLLAAAVLLACSDADSATRSPASSTPADEAREALAARGERIYRAQCTACHHIDPTQDGGIGPAVDGSPLELLEVKVLRNEYPTGYEPKRDTQMMVPLPHLEAELSALAAYLERAAR
jgi:mono/diheme cytochrome c family protein